ncbi:hypothetical protein IFM89_025675 [Coptis chinensis]|uniref:FCP1 homology domain-containing protein n=1 Tax=Coptis chinensis TaxID=261450 RepID=A0A835HM83_9MAGN|nr:hypothetical protein IFM89_025675 [Coptis chinensis]
MEGLLIERPLISKTKRKLLILDVNGLLLHIGNKFDLPLDCIADKFISRKAILKRPSCVDFLKFCFQRFNVAVWSSRTMKFGWCAQYCHGRYEVPIVVLLGPIPLLYYWVLHY